MQSAWRQEANLIFSLKPWTGEMGVGQNTKEDEYPANDKTIPSPKRTSIPDILLCFDPLCHSLHLLFQFVPGQMKAFYRGWSLNSLKLIPELFVPLFLGKK